MFWRKLLLQKVLYPNPNPLTLTNPNPLLEDKVDMLEAKLRDALEEIAALKGAIP